MTEAEIIFRLRDAITGNGDSTNVEGWLRIIERAGLMLVPAGPALDVKRSERSTVSYFNERLDSHFKRLLLIGIFIHVYHDLGLIVQGGIVLACFGIAFLYARNDARSERNTNHRGKQT